MNSLKTIVFPGTDIYSFRQHPLFLLFQNVSLVSPVEGPDEGPSGKCSDSFIKSGFCQVVTPAPLGADRSRFLRLLADIKNRKDDYASQLSHLTLASMSGIKNTDEDSEAAILRNLSSSDQNDKGENDKRSKQEEQNNLLWQARLILAIGELLDEEEEDVAKNLAILDEDEAELFRTLRGDLDAELDEDEEEENPFAELSLLEGKLGGTSPATTRKRCAAWRRLFSVLPTDANADQPKPYEIILASNMDAADLLFEEYEQRTGASAIELINIELPGVLGWTAEESTELINTFSDKEQKAQTVLGQFRQFLADAAAGHAAGKSSNENTDVIHEAWAQILERSFPAKRFGRIQAKLFLLPNRSVDDTLKNSSDTSSATVNEGANSDCQTHALIAVFS